MSLRLFRIPAYYEHYLAQFYKRRPDLIHGSYSMQHAALMADAFNQSNFYTQALNEQGYEVEEVVAYAEPLQKRWAAENGTTYHDESWVTDILFAQIGRFRPDVLWIEPWEKLLGAEFVQRCRVISPALRLVIGQCGEAHPGVAYYRAHDLVMSCAPEVVELYRQQGAHAEVLPHGFEPRLLPLIAQPNPTGAIPRADLGFVGQFIFGDQFHTARANNMLALAQQIEPAIYGEIQLPGFLTKKRKGFRHDLRNRYYGLVTQLARWKLEPLARRLPRYPAATQLAQKRADARIFEALRPWVHPPVYGLEMFRVVASFKIHLNAHGPAVYASNRRMYETTGVGTCLLTDWKPNIADLFEPDREVVTYQSPAEAIEKVRYLLDHEGERRAIAAAGQQRILRDHTVAQRAALLDSLITKALDQQPGRPL